MSKYKIGRLIRKYFLFSFRSTIISLFLPVMIFFIAITGFLSYRVAVTQLEENAFKNIEDTVFQTKGYLENRLSDVFEQLVAFSNDPRTLSIINSEQFEADPEDYIEMNSFLKTIHLNYNSIIESIYVDMNHGAFTLYQSQYPTKIKEFPYKEYEDLYKGNDEGFYWHNVHKDDIFKSESKVVSVFKLVGNQASDASGVLLFNLRNDFFEKVLNKSLIGEHGYIALVSPDGTLNSKDMADEYLLNEDNLKYLKDLKEDSGRYEFQSDDGRKMMVIYETIGINKWKVAAVFSTDEIVEKADYIKYITLIVILVLVGIAILIANFFARYISSPVSTLVEQSKSINENNLTMNYNHNGPREIEILNNAMEDLLTRVNHLLDQIKLEQEEKRQLEFAILHSQINPHFLYNTLYSIKGLCDMGLNGEASSMITALSNFFRISISKGKEIISLEEEITHIRNYLVIQEMRYGDDFSYQIEMDEKILNWEIVKLTLQPLIENAIYHGVKLKRGKGIIAVKGYEKGETIVLEVMDNGGGISKERLAEIRVELEKPSEHSSSIGIGLKSVHERISMHFGSPYGLVLESEEGKGTKNTVIIPKTRGGV
ncbi:sensor histidine kinase [Mesobacillus foraminis]|uniref:sensor histidine kinase n=1 Tax=Mesobacillus foraminis TaxID=279826 RepID=UPI000EF4E4C8|nr:sensor histidine kinase [Mesobacillus foraminis]